jgi:hypothetical protein
MAFARASPYPECQHAPTAGNIGAPLVASSEIAFIKTLRRLEFRHTPKRASWLNMVEIEIGVLRSQCLDRRIRRGACWRSCPGKP